MKKEQAQEHICKKCGQSFSYKKANTYFDDKGYGYSTRLIDCPHCNTINVLKYYEDRAMKLNNDSRFYNYEQKTFLK